MAGFHVVLYVFTGRNRKWGQVMDSHDDSREARTGTVVAIGTGAFLGFALGMGLLGLFGGQLEMLACFSAVGTGIVLTPNSSGRFHYCPQFIRLVLHRDRVAHNRGRKAALRAERQLLQGEIVGCFVNSGG